MAKKILVLGVGQNNFLSFLYGTLKNYDASFSIKAPFIQNLHKEVEDATWMYDNQDLATKVSFLNTIKAFVISIFSSHLWHTFFFILMVERKSKKALHFFLKHIQSQAFFFQNNGFKEIDVFHFHFIQYSYLRELFFIPKNKKIICTFWGSDLLRTSDIFNFYFVRKALIRADSITCQSLELKEIILSKFGRHLSDKIKIALFPMDESIYNTIDKHRNNETLIDNFKVKYGYSPSKRNSMIGHNGSIFNNHLKIIESLNDIQHKKDLHLIVNLNYALDNDNKLLYKSNLVKALEQTGISFTLLETFFSKEELPLSRLATDIFIHMPISDALSGTMTEMLYAGTMVITGSWLPYKTFKKMSLYYHEIDDFAVLPAKIDEVILEYDVEKRKILGNKRAIQEYFFSDIIIENWISILS